MQNHYFNNTHPLHPYTHSLPATPGTTAPTNALRGDAPTIKKGFWPCEKGDSWTDVEDHRKRDEAGGFPPELRQEGTPYWLPEDTYGTPARKMTDIGPLPEGAILMAPEKPEPTIFEQVQAVQQRYQGALNTLLTAMTAAIALDDVADAAAIKDEYAAMLAAMENEIAAITG